MEKKVSLEPVYADFNGSSPLIMDVREYLLKRIQDGPFANPNSSHRQGKRVLMAMENARAVCSKILGADFNQIIFNSGSTEGIASVFHSVLKKVKGTPKNQIIISGIEHSAIPNTAKCYEDQGFVLRVLPTSPEGIIDIETLKKWLKEDDSKTAMISIMAANNETGVIQPYKEIAQLAKNHLIPYFCDTTQFIGKSDFNFRESGCDFAVCSGHKIGAMTGAGILLVKNPESFAPLIVGGGQEKGLRGGTQNYLGYETIAVALESFEKNKSELSLLNKKRNEFENQIKAAFPKVVIIGEKAPRLAGTTYISYPGIHGQAVQIELESQNIFVSTSSACSDNSPKTSSVLKSMGVDDAVGRGVVRISLSLCSKPDHYDRVLQGLKKAYEKLEKINSF